MLHLSEQYFCDYESYTENDILKIDEKGIHLKNGEYIDFAVCAENFQRVYPNGNKNCIGEREITDFSFSFYSSPKPIMIIFLKRGKLAEFFSNPNTIQRFHIFQRKIESYGYRTFDLT